MRQLAARFIRNRRQLTIGGLLIVVAIAALVANWFRPLTRMEIARIGEERFLSWPFASQFKGRYRVQPQDLGYWQVLIVESDTDEVLAVIWIDHAGKLKSVGLGDKLVSLRDGGGKRMPAGGPQAEQGQTRAGHTIPDR